MKQVTPKAFEEFVNRIGILQILAPTLQMHLAPVIFLYMKCFGAILFLLVADFQQSPGISAALKTGMVM
jgi:hypothetical protein